MKALEKERSRRYDTANGFALDIMRHLNDEPVSASPPSTKYRIRKFIKRNRAGVMAAVSIAGVLLLGVVGTTSGMFWALSQKKIADQSAIRATKAEEQTAEALKEVEAERDAKELRSRTPRRKRPSPKSSNAGPKANNESPRRLRISCRTNSWLRRTLTSRQTRCWRLAVKPPRRNGTRPFENCSTGRQRNYPRTRSSRAFRTNRWSRRRSSPRWAGLMAVSAS